MSKDSSKAKDTTSKLQPILPLAKKPQWFSVNLSVKTGRDVLRVVALAVLLFLLPQIVATIIIAGATGVMGWSAQETTKWVTDSTAAQFTYMVIAQVLTLAFLFWLMKKLRDDWRSIGVITRPSWAILSYALVGFGVYYLSLIAMGVLGQFLPIDLNQEQQIGFSKNAAGLDLLMVFISLVVLPPIIEEIVFRGFLYSKLRKALPVIWSAVVVSITFAVAHLQFGSGEALLWVAALDTFILSMILVYLRVKTGNIWAGVLLHAAKNGIAFTLLFVVQ